MQKILFVNLYLLVGLAAMAQTHKFDVTPNGIIFNSGLNQVNITPSGSLFGSGANQANFSTNGLELGNGTNKLTLTSNSIGLGSSKASFAANSINLGVLGGGGIGIDSNGLSLNCGNSSSAYSTLGMNSSGTAIYTNGLFYNSMVVSDILKMGIGDAQPGYHTTISNEGDKLGGVFIRNNPNATTSDDPSCGLFVEQNVLVGTTQHDYAKQNAAIRANASANTSTSYARTYGVHASAGGGFFNYGVYAQLNGSQMGSAIYGNSSAGDANITTGRFAGYFAGNVYMDGRLGISYGCYYPSYDIDTQYGTIRYLTSVVTSDSRLKTNIVDLGNSLGKIGQLRPVTYNMLSLAEVPEYAYIYEEMKKPDAPETEMIDKNRKHIGFLAQEVKEIYPELVYEDDKGMLSIDYVSLIPVLVGTIQELSKRLEALENKK